ncbi:MAG: hypothetical protein ABI587_00350 [Gemmatimonadales bacterium]
MSIDPTSPKPVSGTRSEPGSSKGVRQSGDMRIGVPRLDSREAEGTTGDQVELSSDARAAGEARGAASASGLSSSRLRDVLQRLTSGFYDTAQVRDTVARRVHTEQDL